MKRFYCDLETTGLNPSACAIHQCAIVVESGSYRKAYNFKIKPHDNALYQEGWDVSDVTQSQVEAYELTHQQFYKELISILNSLVNKYDKTDKLFWIGYNSRFDEDFMRALFRRNNDNFFGSYFWTPSLDVMARAAFVLAPVRNTLPNFKLATVYNYVTGHELADAHDGLADIEATIELLNAL